MTARPAHNDYINWATDGDPAGGRVKPSAGQIIRGWHAGDRPPSSWWNDQIANLSAWIGYFDSDHLPSVAHTDADSPVFGAASKPNAHPGSGANLWKEVIQAINNSNSRVRFMAGPGGNAAASFAITWNAAWQAAAGDQSWVRDDNAQDSAILWCDGQTLRFQTKAAGSGSFAAFDSTSATLAIPNIAVSGDATVGDDLIVNGDLTVNGAALLQDTEVDGTLTVTTDAVIPAINGTVLVNGDVEATGEHLYDAPKTRSSPIPLGRASGAVRWPSNGQAGCAPLGTDEIVWHFQLPATFSTGAVRILMETGSGAGGTFRLMRYNNIAFSGTPALPTRTEISSATPAGSSLQYVTLVGAGAIAAGDDFFVHWEPGATSDRVYALQLFQWSDNGPRSLP